MKAYVLIILCMTLLTACGSDDETNTTDDKNSEVTSNNWDEGNWNDINWQ